MKTSAAKSCGFFLLALCFLVGVARAGDKEALVVASSSGSPPAGSKWMVRADGPDGLTFTSKRASLLIPFPLITRLLYGYKGHITAGVSPVAIPGIGGFIPKKQSTYLLTVVYVDEKQQEQAVWCSTWNEKRPGPRC